MVTSFPESFLPQVPTLGYPALSAGAQVSGGNPVFKGIYIAYLHVLNYWADLLCSCLCPAVTSLDLTVTGPLIKHCLALRSYNEKGCHSMT